MKRDVESNSRIYLNVTEMNYLSVHLIAGLYLLQKKVAFLHPFPRTH